MDKKAVLIIIPIIVATFSAYGIYSMLTDSKPNYILNLGLETNRSNILSGLYTGNVIIDGISLVPEGKSATISNAEFVSDDIYVYGEIIITNSTFYADIFVMGAGLARFKDVILKNDGQIYCYENTSVYIESISRVINYTDSLPLPELISFDFSQILINNSVITSHSYGQSSLTLVNMQNETITSQETKIIMFQEAKVNIFNSSVDYVYLNEFTSAFGKPVLRLNSSTVKGLTAYSNSTTWIQNSSRVTQILGFQNAIFYLDGSSSIGVSSLFDNAQIIPI